MTPTHSRWNAPEPMNLGTGFVLLGLGGMLGCGYLLERIFAGQDDAPLLLLLACSLLFSGSARMLLVLGKRIAHRLQGEKKRCGCCHFFEVPSGLYVIGRCQADPSKSTVTRADGCASFCFSERAMVGDRLSQHPGILKQLQIIRTSDTTRQS